MEFLGPYLEAMRQQAPKMFNRLRRTGALEAFAKKKAIEASQMYRTLTADAPRDAAGLVKQPQHREAEEIVRALLIEFPPDDETEQESLGEQRP